MKTPYCKDCKHVLNRTEAQNWWCCALTKTTRLTGSVFRASILLDGLVAPGSSPSRSMSAFTLCSNLELGDLIADGSSSHRSLSAFTLCNLELGDLIADGTRTVARVGPLAGALSP